MDLDKVIEHFGNVANLSNQLGISTQAIYDWKGKVPDLRQWQIEVLTNGKLKADRKTKTDQSEAA